MAARKPAVRQGNKQAAAKQTTARAKVAKATKDVKTSREAAQDMEVTDVGGWKGRVERAAVKLLLPSGNVCLAFNEGMMSFIESGKVPNALMPIIMDAINEGKGMAPDAVKKLANDSRVIQDMMAMVNSAVVSCVVQPKISPAPLAVRTIKISPASLAVRTIKSEDAPDVVEEYIVLSGQVGVDADGNGVERDPKKMYVDELDMNDKMFLFNWVMGGSKDIERFRTQSAAALESLSEE